ncbi:4Fe-4S binding protein [candidate division KSB1 bacterium]|nr:4Fe-4S binding protein [candidate division KSB1 bacterium]RQW06707.1 MAG: 4Fe-4S dicluster domain-containing protein [candidate division KSB1 bacterium]
MEPIVSTIETKCKRCYSCIRQCPANAIRVVNGQAKVIEERCIACGNCIKVCPQHAKQIRDGTRHSFELLAGDHSVIAVLAPSFPAAFANVQPGQVISAIKKLGFSQVLDVAFGADLVAAAYNRILESEVMPIIVTSPCPAIVNFVEKYYPHLCLVLAPVVSPMIAIGRVIQEKYQPDAKIIFIGPCIAKKKEMFDENVAGIIDEVLTFNELEVMLEQKGIDICSLSPQEFDGPMSDMGQVFPISGGLIKCSDSDDDILNSDVLVSEGRERVLEVLKKVDAGDIEARFVDILFCRGCIKGPMLANDESVFVRRDRIVKYIKSQQDAERRERAQLDRQKYQDVSMRRRFTMEELTVRQPTEEEIRDILRRTDKLTPEDELNCGACGYPTCREKAIAVYQGFAEAEMCLPFMLEKLEKMQDKLSTSNKKLRDSIKSLRQAQQQLVQSEKLASVGRLAAGVAHELNNPLGGILLFTSILLKKLENSPNSEALQKVAKEAERCRSIVQGLLDFSRQSNLERRETDIHHLLESTLTLITQQALFQNVRIQRLLSPDTRHVFVDRVQLQQVFLNIFLNAAEAMNGHGQIVLKSGNCAKNGRVYISVEDDGPGMSKAMLNHIFDPFYTTKPVGQGTGLGLAIAYGIIEKHQGEIKVESQVGKGTTFTVYLPT